MLEFFAIGFSSIETVEDAVEIGRHFEVVLNRLQDLLSEAGRAAIPEEALFPCEVEKGLRIAFAKSSFEASREINVIAEGEFHHVASGAGDRAIDRKNGVVKESLSKGDAFFRKKVISGEIGLFENRGLREGELSGSFRRSVLGKDGGQAREETDHG